MGETNKNEVLYPYSKYITDIQFSDLTLYKGDHIHDTLWASGDQWAITWADNGQLYAGWSDGTGFGYNPLKGWWDQWTTHLGLSQINGDPPDITGQNIWGGYEPLSLEGALYVHRDRPEGELYVHGDSTLINLKSSSGLIFINGTFYWYVSEMSNPQVTEKSIYCRLLSSNDYGKTWTDNGRIFQEEGGKFSYTGVVQFGPNYSGVPSSLNDYLYLFYGGSNDIKNPYFQRKEMLLARVHVDSLTFRNTYQFFNGTPKKPSWTKDIQDARPIFQDENEVSYLVQCVYNPGLERYIMTCKNSPNVNKEIDGPDLDSKGFGIFEAKQPWGPWKTVYYTKKVGNEIPGLTLAISLTLTPKWMSENGEEMWIVFAGRPSNPMYSFNLIKANLTVNPRSK